MGRTLQLTRRKCRTKSFSDLQKTIACILEREREREKRMHIFEKKNNNNNCTRLLAAVSCVNLVFPPFTRNFTQITHLIYTQRNLMRSPIPFPFPTYPPPSHFLSLPIPFQILFSISPHNTRSISGRCRITVSFTFAT